MVGSVYTIDFEKCPDSPSPDIRRRNNRHLSNRCLSIRGSMKRVDLGSEETRLSRDLDGQDAKTKSKVIKKDRIAGNPLSMKNEEITSFRRDTRKLI